jgi:hypothetical protein
MNLNLFEIKEISSTLYVAPYTLERHCTKNRFYVIPEMKLHGLVLKSYIVGSVSDLNIPRIGLPICCSKVGRSSLSHMNVEFVNKAVQFHFCEYIKRIFFVVQVHLVLNS